MPQPDIFEDLLNQMPDDPEEEAVEESDEPLDEPEAAAKKKPFDLSEHYWALFPYMSDEYADKVTELFDDHVDLWMGSSSYSTLVFDSYRAYHGLDGSMLSEPTIRLETAGEQGELLSMRPNNVRSLVKHQVAMVTSDRPAWQPQANNANSEAQNQVPMASNLLDYALTRGLHKDLVDQDEASTVCGESFMVLGWNANLGLNKKGWFTSHVAMPWEMARQRTRNYNDCSWWVWRTFENRMDWVAKFAESDPDKAEEIFKTDQSSYAWGVAPLDGHEERDVECEGDRIAVLNVFVRPSASCPLGRLSKIAGPKLVLEDVPSPFGDIVPIIRQCPAEFIGTSIPYSDTWMLIAPAEAINVVVGTIMTRIDMFGIPSVAAPSGSELGQGDFGGANLLEMGVGEKPTVIDLLQLPEGLMQAMGMFEKMLENFSGINSVTRGSPQENVSSGSMAALLQAMAVQYNSTHERAWALNLEAVGTALLRIFQTCASEDVMVAITGAEHTSTVAKFKGEDISSILQVNVQIANPVMKTTAGKMQIANDLLQNKLIQNGAEYMNVLQTGQLESMFEGPVSHLRIARAENEMILRGETPRVLWSDNHLVHLQTHLPILNGDVRYDETMLGISDQHIQQHIMEWMKASREQPDFCMAIGIPVLPQSGAAGEQGRQMEAMSMGAPPAPPTNMGAPPPPQKIANAEPTKAAPGPAGAPKGQEPSQAAPKEPAPAKTPAGAPVV